MVYPFCRVQSSTCSYLNPPRIHFYGRFRANTSSINNLSANYNMSFPESELVNVGGVAWGQNATGEFAFEDAYIKSVTYINGTRSFTDPIVGKLVVTNPGKTTAKIVDLDTECIKKSTVFGLKFGVNWPIKSTESTRDAFIGDWVPSLLTKDYWMQVICDNPRRRKQVLSPEQAVQALTHQKKGYNYSLLYDGPHPGYKNSWLYKSGGKDSSIFLCEVPQNISVVEEYFDDQYVSARSSSKIGNITWSEEISSPILRELKEASAKTGYLSVSVALHLFTFSDQDYLYKNFSYGLVTGTIGVGSRDEPLNFSGERLLSFEFVDQPKLPSQEMKDCATKVPVRHDNLNVTWMSKAPFVVSPAEQRVTIDFSSAISKDIYSNVRNLGELFLGIFDSSEECVIRSRSLFLNNSVIQDMGGLLDFKLPSWQIRKLVDSKLVVARLQGSERTTRTTYPFCGQQGGMAMLMILERPYFLRPYDQYIFRMQANETISLDLFLTHFGQPVAGVDIEMFPGPEQISSITNAPPTPRHDEAFNFTKIATTNIKGRATFTFSSNDIGYPRGHLPIDGQVYCFLYRVKGDPQFCNHTDLRPLLYHAWCINEIAIRVWSSNETFKFVPPYTWVDHIQPIFLQYKRLYPAMRNILNLGNYSDVTLPRNIRLINMSMRLDVNHPSYMPTTRDLSPLKQKVILDWLENPLYSHSSEPAAKTEETCPSNSHSPAQSPPFDCQLQLDVSQLAFDADKYYAKFAQRNKDVPMSSWQEDALAGNCTIEKLRGYLQNALEIEFATIPLYLTALYSIRDGCNTWASRLIRGVVMQEMLHLTQSANLLISVGGRPIIDGPNTAIKYPTKGLPGGVLPNLQIPLRKFSLQQIHDVFMAVEYPHFRTRNRDDPQFLSNTIGQFYIQIEECMEYLLTVKKEDIFCDCADRQVKWPYQNDYGTVHIVTNMTTAKEAILEIIEQGEGTGPGNPVYLDSGDYAHFYKFKEIYCQHQLVKNGTKYSFSGPDITFNPNGVWSMQDNPSKFGLGTGNVYNTARAFNQLYHGLLKTLQEVFDSNPDGILQSLPIMESLELYGKQLMRDPVPNDPSHTCGPVFDYDWE